MGVEQGPVSNLHRQRVPPPWRCSKLKSLLAADSWPF